MICVHAGFNCKVHFGYWLFHQLRSCFDKRGQIHHFNTKDKKINCLCKSNSSVNIIGYKLRKKMILFCVLWIHIINLFAYISYIILYYTAIWSGCQLYIFQMSAVSLYSDSGLSEIGCLCFGPHSTAMPMVWLFLLA